MNPTLPTSHRPAPKLPSTVSNPNSALNSKYKSSEYGCLENDGPTPIAAYSFDEGAGTTLYDSAGNHDGMIEGASWSGEGKYGSSLTSTAATTLSRSPTQTTST